jgi:hypothetical protein
VRVRAALAVYFKHVSQVLMSICYVGRSLAWRRRLQACAIANISTTSPHFPHFHIPHFHRLAAQGVLSAEGREVAVQCFALRLLADFTLMYQHCVGVLLKRDTDLATKEVRGAAAAGRDGDWAAGELLGERELLYEGGRAKACGCVAQRSFGGLAV